MGLNFRSARGLWEIETPLLKRAHRISCALRPKAEAVIWKEPGSDSPADLEDSPREAGSNWDSPWWHICWQQIFFKAYASMKTLVLANAILESSLYFISGGTWPTSCQHQSWDATCQAATWAGTQPHPLAF